VQRHSLYLACLLGMPHAIATENDPARLVELESIKVVAFMPDTVQIGTFGDAAPLDVPQLTHVITREVLDAQQAGGIHDALRNTAGVTRAQLNGAAYDNIAIRGILVENRANYRLNGSLPVINLIDIPLENKQRVEVLKGVSSLYYGLVPPSGIVNLVSKRAGRDPLTALALSLNDHGAAQLHVDLARRYGRQRQFGVRANFAIAREDNGLRGLDGDSHLASVALDWQASETLAMALDLENYAKDVGDAATIAVPAPVRGSIPLPGAPDARLTLSAPWMRYAARASNLLWRVNWQPNTRWSLLLEAGVARLDRDRHYAQFERYDLASGEGQLRVMYTPGQSWENRNLRAQASGLFGSGSVGHALTLGYVASRRSQDPRVATTARLAQNLYVPRALPHLAMTPSGKGNPSMIRDDLLYLSDRIHFGAHWQALLGVSASRYRSRGPSTEYRANEAMPSASLLWQPRHDTSFYATYAEGLEETGWAPSNRANAGELMPPARAKQMELGAKLQWGGALLQGAVFEIRRPTTTIDSANRFVLNGLSRYRGLELVANGKLFDRLDLVASALWLDARQLARANPATYNRIPVNTPRTTASLFVSYPLASLPSLALNSGIYYTGRRPVDNENRAFIGGYATWSLGLAWTPIRTRHPFTLRATLDNVGGRQYWSTAANGLLGAALPRTLSLQGSWLF
jgi:iron complex outermembrane receptor protein